MEVLEEARLATLHRSSRYQQTLRRYHERRIRERKLQVGDLVLRRVIVDAPYLPNLCTTSAQIVVAFPLEYSPKHEANRLVFTI